MLFDSELWPRLHGASTHFPLALTLAAALLESLSLLWPAHLTQKKGFHSAGYFMIVLAALGTFPAVISGLFMTRGEILGHGALLFHHLFVWPAFLGILGLAFWRHHLGDIDHPKFFRAYLICLILLSGLMGAAGYWGGEMILNATPLVISSDRTTIQLGKKYFQLSCAHCHGEDARGDEGPDLHHLALSNALIASTLENGIEGEMPAFSKKYHAGEISALIAYLRSLP